MTNLEGLDNPNLPTHSIIETDLHDALWKTGIHIYMAEIHPL